MTTAVLTFNNPKTHSRERVGFSTRLDVQYLRYLKRLRNEVGINQCEFIESLIDAHMNSSANPFRQDEESPQAG